MALPLVFLVGHNHEQDKVEVENANAEPGNEYVYTIEHEVNVVNLSQSGCGEKKIEEENSQGVGFKNP